ncbi:MAG: helix-turn-helix transcriptional regulator [Clostridia bacterium]|nr:helix-turn-helix transcriptional regulator [Clostridia bacterium]
MEFAQKIGVTKQCVSNWENDNILPSVEMLVTIADFFSVPTDVLLGRSSDDVISVEGLSDEEIAHLRAIVKDLQKARK